MPGGTSGSSPGSARNRPPAGGRTTRRRSPAGRSPRTRTRGTGSTTAIRPSSSPRWRRAIAPRWASRRVERAWSARSTSCAASRPPCPTSRSSARPVRRGSAHASRSNQSPRIRMRADLPAGHRLRVVLPRPAGGSEPNRATNRSCHQARPSRSRTAAIPSRCLAKKLALSGRGPPRAARGRQLGRRRARLGPRRLLRPAQAPRQRVEGGASAFGDASSSSRRPSIMAWAATAAASQASSATDRSASVPATQVRCSRPRRSARWA